MKLLLKKDVKDVGKRGEIVEASDGYARNFLIPKGFAEEATNANINKANQIKKNEAAKKSQDHAQAVEFKNRVEKLSSFVAGKSGENGKLFGSITSKDIADAFKTQHRMDLDKKKIVLSEPIKNLGEYEIEYKVYPEVSATLKVLIKAE